MIPVFYSDRFLEHNTGAYHPENPGRLTAIVQALQTVSWSDQVAWRSPTEVSQRDPLPWIHQVHSPTYVETVATLASRGGGYLDGDTPVSAQSYDIACLAVNAWLDGIDTALDTGSPSFVLARPPGHHALPNRGMGFCIFANAAIAAHYALQQPNVNRVAILDWDVHHGNGTEAIVQSHPQIAYCSLHEYPFYPGTGAALHQGDHQNVLNIPLAAGSTIADYQPPFEEKVMPFLQEFKPDLLIVSAGYDATLADQLAHMALQPQDYRWFTHHCLSITAKIVFGLEGGYDYKALGQSVAATLEACLTHAFN
jgi:acetoin utilization deacetylase AcuC-like enzyme